MTNKEKKRVTVVLDFEQYKKWREALDYTSHTTMSDFVRTNMDMIVECLVSEPGTKEVLIVPVDE